MDGVFVQPTPASAFSNAVMAFLTSYQLAQDRKKQQAAQTFQQGLTMLAQGLPGVDLKKMAKAARVLELPLDFSGESTKAAQTALQQQKLAQVQQIQQAYPTLPLGGLTQAVELFGPGYMQEGRLHTPPPVQPSAWQRFGQALGLSKPPIEPFSPGMLFLQGLQQQGARAGAMQQLAMDAQQALMTAFKGALGGDPRALEMAARFGLGQMTDLDLVRSLASAAGIPEQEAMKNFAFVKLGGLDAAKVFAQLAVEGVRGTVEGNKQVAELFEKFTSLFPTAPPSWALAYAGAMQQGDTAAALKLLEAASSFKTKPKLEAEWKERELAFRLEDLRQGARRLGQMDAQIGLEKMKLEQAADRLGLDKLQFYSTVANYLRSQAEKAFDDYITMLKSDVIKPEQLEVAARRAADALNKLNEAHMPLPDGRVLSLSLGKWTAEDVRRVGLFGLDFLRRDLPGLKQIPPPVAIFQPFLGGK